MAKRPYMQSFDIKRTLRPAINAKQLVKKREKYNNICYYVILPVQKGKKVQALGVKRKRYEEILLLRHFTCSKKEKWCKH